MILYTKVNEYCPQCAIAKVALKERGIEFEERALDTDEWAKERELYKDLGFRAAPLLIRGEEVIMTGYDPRVIETL